MPRYYPNTRFSDCWASAGDVTFYHRNGKCFWRKRSHPAFPGTMKQMEHQEVHKRALEAWKLLPAGIQEQWGLYAVGVPSHRPPFRDDHSITGHNLFISAYHGYARLGDEHVPTPHAYVPFPVFHCSYDSASVQDGRTLKLRLRTMLEKAADPSRYRVLVRVQLTRPGAGRQPGYMRTFVARENCCSSDGIVEIEVTDYKRIWNLDLSEYQVHMRYLLIDSKTGYRCNYQKTSYLMRPI